jgi:hypothetical protein
MAIRPATRSVPLGCRSHVSRGVLARRRATRSTITCAVSGSHTRVWRAGSSRYAQPLFAANESPSSSARSQRLRAIALPQLHLSYAVRDGRSEDVIGRIEAFREHSAAPIQAPSNRKPLVLRIGLRRSPRPPRRPETLKLRSKPLRHNGFLEMAGETFHLGVKRAEPLKQVK